MNRIPYKMKLFFFSQISKVRKFNLEFFDIISAPDRGRREDYKLSFDFRKKIVLESGRRL